MTSQLLNSAAVAAKLGISIETLHRIRRTNPEFPKAIQLGGPRSRLLWRAADLDSFVMSVAA
jgi:predicted DNA-binding transcriptional regulator AlpA